MNTATCTITVGDHIHRFEFANLSALDIGIAAFKTKIEAARQLLPLIFLGNGHPAPAAPSPLRAAAAPAAAAPAKASAVALRANCPKCGRQYANAGKCLAKHVAHCAAGGKPAGPMDLTERALARAQSELDNPQTYEGRKTVLRDEVKTLKAKLAAHAAAKSRPSP